ncbi:MAG: heme-binding protein, partial [Proteobacteria bacterium]
MFEILKSIPAAVGIRLDEEPPYTVLEKKGDVEVRSYNKILVAQVEVPGAHSTSAGDGFRKLASYIFGGNTEKANMAMTIPVLQEQTQKTGNESWRSTFV